MESISAYHRTRGSQRVLTEPASKAKDFRVAVSSLGVSLDKEHLQGHNEMSADAHSGTASVPMQKLQNREPYGFDVLGRVGSL